MNDKPFVVEISGGGFGASIEFASMGEAYQEARHIRDVAVTGRPVHFTSKFGKDGLYQVLAIRILRWNPLVNGLLVHARSWDISETAQDALTPLPDDWYLEPLPEDWRTSPAPARQQADGVEQAVRRLLSRKVREKAVDRQAAHQLILDGLPAARAFVENWRSDGHASQDLLCKIQIKMDEARQALDAATDGIEKQQANLALATAELYLEVLFAP